MAERVQLKRAKGWRMPPNTLRVARPGVWGNPFKVGEDAPNAETAVRLYRKRLEYILTADPTFLEELRGKNLACFCPLDAPCHADVLLELANAAPEQGEDRRG